MPVLLDVVDVVDTQNPALFAIFGVVGIVAIVAAGAFSKKLGVAAPLLLILIGFGFSYIPGAPNYVPHELILMGLLPPILYSAAINVPIVDFRRNFRAISALSVALVVVTRVRDRHGAVLPVPGARVPGCDRDRRGHQPDRRRGRDRARQAAGAASATGEHPRGREPRQRRDRAGDAALGDRRDRRHRDLLGGRRATSSSR